MAHIPKGNKSMELIINYAIDEFAQSGSKASINTICSKYNISKGRMYHFFASKEDLLCCCFEYSLDKISKTIESFEVDPSLSVERNFHKYYINIINHWLKNPNEIIVIKLESKAASLSFTKENKNRIIKKRNEWSDTVTKKFLEIISKKNMKTKIDEEMTNRMVSILYNQLFLTFSNDLISALKDKDYARAKQMKINLLKYFDIVIETFLYGIIDEKKQDI